jgi:hypothetical protein
MESQILSDSALKDHAGWSMSSNIPQVYVHLRGESSKIFLQKEGIIKRAVGDNVFRLLHPNTQAEF